MTRTAWMAALAGLAWLGGCESAAKVSPSELTAAPPDLMIDMTVLDGTPIEAREAVNTAPAHRRQARYVLLADGLLRYGSDPERGADWLPDPVRRLERVQMDDVWSLLRELELADPAAGNKPGNAAMLQASEGELIRHALIAGAGQRWAVVESRPPSDESTTPLDALARRLAELAWADDEAEVDARTVPRRYDFGPDPYARYRTHAPNNE